MRLLSVNMTLDPRSGGGSAARTFEMCRLLASAGVPCEIATADEALEALPATSNLQVIGVPVAGGRLRIPIGGHAALRAAVARADVVMFVNHWTAINALVWRYVSARRVPYIVCPAGALPVDGGRSRLLKRLYNRVVGHALVARASAHVAVTHDETSQFAPYGIDPANVTVIPNVMPDVAAGDARRFRTDHGLSDGPLLLFLGRLAPIKGPDLLVDAFARIAASRPDWQLVMAGPDDGMLARLAGRVEQAGLAGRVFFTGFLDRQGKGDALAAADLLVVPSRREAMSIVVLEAAAAGRPVLITDQCGVPDVAATESGWIVPADVDGLAAGLLEATADRARLTERGARWQVEAARRYSAAEVTRRYLELLERVRSSAQRTA